MEKPWERSGLQAVDSSITPERTPLRCDHEFGVVQRTIYDMLKKAFATKGMVAATLLPYYATYSTL